MLLLVARQTMPSELYELTVLLHGPQWRMIRRSRRSLLASDLRTHDARLLSPQGPRSARSRANSGMEESLLEKALDYRSIARPQEQADPKPRRLSLDRSLLRARMSVAS